MSKPRLVAALTAGMAVPGAIAAKPRVWLSLVLHLALLASWAYVCWLTSQGL